MTAVWPAIFSAAQAPMSRPASKLSVAKVMSAAPASVGLVSSATTKTPA